MTGEELNDDELMALFEALDGHHRHIIISHGDLSMQKETQRAGIDSLIYWLKGIKYGLKMLLL